MNIKTAFNLALVALDGDRITGHDGRTYYGESAVSNGAKAKDEREFAWQMVETARYGNFGLPGGLSAFITSISPVCLIPQAAALVDEMHCRAFAELVVTYGEQAPDPSRWS